jgi:signal transduction histidine kinase
MKRMFFAAAALVMATGVAAILMFIRMVDASDWVSHTLTVRSTASGLLRLMDDVETGARGYLLTGEESFLEPYGEAIKRIGPDLEKLRSLTAGDEAQQRLLDKLAPLVASKLDIEANAISLRRQGEKDQAAIKTGPGKAVMDEIRAVLAEFSKAEDRLLEARQEKDRQARSLLLFLILAGLAGASALSVAAIYYQGQLIERLREEAARREKAEATLRQAHKMEAVGRLTGGVAHDFNNILTIIMGNLDTISRRLANLGSDASMPLARPMEDALQGAKNAAKLTHRLLAFSRQQPLEPVPLDLNKLVGGISNLLTRTVGSPISVETILAAGLWQTLADANQLENALLNLAINAKDAMPDGGTLTIETANSYLDESYAARFGDVAAGQYVTLSVTDTGTGIAPDVMERIFEPFFTTKQAGVGTGLGLSMVHGFVKQSGGHIRIYSEVGHGTTVKIYLPRLTQETAVFAAPKGMEANLAPVTPSRGFETVLAVEDNEGVLEFACQALEDLGYCVITANDGPEALRHLESKQRIDLLFTDIVMTKEMTGRQLADCARKIRPRLRVLFTTGYSPNAVVHQGRVDRGVHLLCKPYTQRQLAEKIRAILDGGQN